MSEMVIYQQLGAAVCSVFFRLRYTNTTALPNKKHTLATARNNTGNQNMNRTVTPKFFSPGVSELGRKWLLLSGSLAKTAFCP
jgi:hypothetical protein